MNRRAADHDPNLTPVGAAAFNEFARDTVERMDALGDRLQKVDDFLFIGTEGRPSLEQIMIKLERHVQVMCANAALARRLVISVGAVSAGALSTFMFIEHAWPIVRTFIPGG
jgi:hypothetical protein